MSRKQFLNAVLCRKHNSFAVPLQWLKQGPQNTLWWNLHTVHIQCLSPHRQTLAPSITYTSYHRTSISLAAYIITVIKSGSLQKWWILYGRVLLPLWLPQCIIKLSEWHYSCKHLNVNDTQCLVSALIQQTHNSLNNLIKITPNSLKSLYSIPT
jgi:hypothetical protein